MQARASKGAFSNSDRISIVPKHLKVQPARSPDAPVPSHGPPAEGETPQDLPVHLALTQAILTWCDPSLVAAVRREEIKLTEHQHAEVGLPLLGDVAALATPGRNGWMIGSVSHTALRGAWDRLFNDFRRKIERGQLFLEGVRLAPERGTTPEEISNSWAADMKFELERNTITLGRDRFGAITVSTRPSPWQVVLERANTVPRAVAVQDVAGLETDVVIALINEHARRVVAEHGKELLPPGTISLEGIVRLKFEERAKARETLPTLGEEAVYLGTWIASAAPAYHAPTSNRIERFIRSRYAELKPRSTTAIQQ